MKPTPKRLAIHALFGVGIAALAPAAVAEWTPPADAEARAILEEARADALAGRHADALDKHIWFHRNSLKDPGMGGVRLSFALQSWKELGERHPPALASLRAEREQAAQKLRAGTGSFGEFHEVAAIDATLGEQLATAELFEWLDSERPDLAKSAYPVAQSALVRAKNYALCGKYLHGAADTDQIVGMHRMNRGMAARDGRMALYTRTSFTNRAATLVALLAVNGRRAEAQAAMAEFLKEEPDAEFRVELNRAAAGAVPEPWPR